MDRKRLVNRLVLDSTELGRQLLKSKLSREETAELKIRMRVIRKRLPIAARSLPYGKFDPDESSGTQFRRELGWLKAQQLGVTARLSKERRAVDRLRISVNKLKHQLTD